MDQIGVDGSLRQPNSNFIHLASVVGCNEDTIQHYSHRLSGIDGNTSHERRRKEEQQAKRSKPHPLAKLALYNIRQERETYDPHQVERQIQLKFLRGGYGQFPRKFVDAIISNFEYDVPNAWLERITLDHRQRTQEEPLPDIRMLLPSLHPRSSSPVSDHSTESDDSAPMASSTGSLDRRGREIGRRSSPDAFSVRSMSPPLLAGKLGKQESASSNPSSPDDDMILPSPVSSHLGVPEQTLGRSQASGEGYVRSGNISPLALPSPVITDRTHAEAQESAKEPNSSSSSSSKHSKKATFFL
jgi:hypothetical protein